MKALKVVATVFAALLLAFGALAAYLVLTFDAARIKQEAAQAVLAKTGRTLTIDGDLAPSFWPSLGVKLEKVSLSERDSRDRFAAFDSAHVSVKVMPLLSRQLIVDRVELDGLHLVLKKNRDGHMNIDDLMAGDKTASVQTESGKAVAARPLQFDIAGIDITNATLEWRDEQAKKSIVLSPLEFSAGHTFGSNGDIGIDDVKLALRGKADADDFDIKLNVPALSKHGETIAIPGLDLKVSLTGAQRSVKGNITLDKVEGSLKVLKIAGLALDVDAKNGDTTLKGGLKSPLALDLDAGIVTLTKIAGTLDLDAPSLPAHPLRLPISGQLKSEYRKPAVSGNLATQFDDSHVAARFNIAAFSPLNFGVDLDIDKLNVDRYLPPIPAVPATGGKGGGVAAGGDKAGEGRIDLSALKAINGSGNLRVGDLQAKNLKARNVRVSFKASRGMVDIAPHSADLYGGHISGTASIDATSKRIALKESLSGIDIQPLLKDLMQRDVVEGHGDVTLDIVTRGDTVAAMKQALSGNARIVLRDGAIKGINIAQSLRTAKAKLGGGDTTQVQSASATDKTDFSEFTASFKIANGVAHNDDLGAKSPFLRLGGSGDIDIGNGRLDYLLKAAVVGTAAGQDGKELDALKGLTVPIRVTGPFDKPAFKLELGSLVNDATKARIDEKKQELKQKMQDNLKGQLKGLFGK